MQNWIQFLGPKEPQPVSMRCILELIDRWGEDRYEIADSWLDYLITINAKPQDSINLAFKIYHYVNYQIFKFGKYRLLKLSSEEHDGTAFDFATLPSRQESDARKEWAKYPYDLKYLVRSGFRETRQSHSMEMT